MIKLSLHLGAHKTATTHIQDTLQFHKRLLRSAGINYIDRKTIRKNGRLINKAVNNFDKYIFFRRQRASNKINKLFLSLIDPDFSTNIISEEDLIGLPQDLLSKQYYSNIKTNLSVLSSLKEAYDISIFLSIRSPATILPSAYSQMARIGKISPNLFNKIKHNTLNNTPLWCPTIKSINKAFSSSPIYIWKYEDYNKKRNSILNLMCGKYNHRHIEFSDIPPPKETSSLSLECIDKIEHSMSGLSRKNQIIKAQEISSNNHGNTNFIPFSEHEIHHLNSKYLYDIEEIKAINNVILL